MQRYHLEILSRSSMHSHHSHSGDYVSHASGTLEEMVTTAIGRGFTHWCLTEHMPRLEDEFLYPEEIEKKYTKDDLTHNFAKYLVHARDVQKRLKAAGKMQVLVGFEVEGIDLPHIEYAKTFQKHTDMCVGSVHYVHGIPIDFDQALWLKAREAAGGTTRSLYKDYFDLQFQVLTFMKPEVVGHFDLIRLFDPNDVDPKTGKNTSDIVLSTDWPEVFAAMERNIKYTIAYGGLFELNSSAIRKGWPTPYPRKDVAELIIKLGGRFCLSDDSHTYAQVGLNYHKVWEYVKELGLENIYHLELDPQGSTTVVGESVSDLSSLLFWHQY